MFALDPIGEFPEARLKNNVPPTFQIPQIIFARKHNNNEPMNEIFEEEVRN